MRLDLFLTENGFASSRTEAKGLITSGAVKIEDKTVTKPAFDVSCDASLISVDRSIKKYVSRGGIKLEGALSAFAIDPTGRMALDIGASSGGFTDCLLQNGAAHVIAVDSGCGQLVQSIREDSRVTVFENYNARYMKREHFEYIPNLAVMDVSFISATYIIPAIYEVLDVGADFVCLIKPQFEVGRAGLSKGGIVKDEKQRQSAVSKVLDCATALGFTVLATMTSPIQGGDGNIEYLAHFRK